MEKKSILIFTLFLLGLLVRGQQKDLILYTYSGDGSIIASRSITLKDGFSIPSGQNARLFISNYPIASVGSSHNQNYILTQTFRKSGVTNLNGEYTVDQVDQSIEYFDGMGRSSQYIDIMGSPTFNNVISFTEYDRFGLNSKQNLPYIETSGQGTYRDMPEEKLLNFYNRTTGNDINGIARTAKPYSQSIIERSPLNRVFEQGAVGEVWQPVANRGSASITGRTTVKVYEFNDANSVLHWTVNSDGIGATSTYYAKNNLFKSVVKGENWTASKSKEGTEESYTDLLGRLVLKRVWETDIKCLDTYYIYNDLHQLIYIVPPGYDETTLSESSVKFNQFVYANKYDSERRIVRQKIPGTDWKYFVYNKRNEVILVQDGLARIHSQWIYFKYDLLGRCIEKGVLNASYNSQQAAQLAADSFFDTYNKHWETRSLKVVPSQPNSFTKYTNESFPKENLTPLIIYYYDDYKFDGADLPSLAAQEITPSTRTKDLATGIVTFKIDGTLPLYTVRFYDDRARVIQSVSQNHFGGIDIVTNTFSFLGELLTSEKRHKSSPSGMITKIFTKNEYDHRGRLLATKHRINEQDTVVLASYVYNELGQLIQKKQHSEDGGITFLNSIAYGYNERGWLTKIWSDSFKQLLKYNTPMGGAEPQYNGNVSEQYWGYSSPDASSAFNYEYNGLNRLKSGVSNVGMNETLEYDAMGNINRLTREDNITKEYTYSGNQLVSVTGNNGGNFLYDENGNVKNDRKGGVFTYNLLNLPNSYERTGTNPLRANYLYNADGSKLRKQLSIGNQVLQRDYIEGIEYHSVNGSNAQIDLIHTDQGFLQYNAGTYVYHYNQTDHLGNVRATLQRTSATTFSSIQRTDYYPFGKRKEIVVSGTNSYLYNNKEHQPELGEDIYDYHTRYYDADIARWNGIDIMAASTPHLSPYQYVGGNPISYNDPTGMVANPFIRNDKTGNVIWIPSFTTTPRGWSIIPDSQLSEDGKLWNNYYESVALRERESIRKRSPSWSFSDKFDAFDMSARTMKRVQEELKGSERVMFLNTQTGKFTNLLTGNGALEDANWIIDISTGGIAGTFKYIGRRFASKAMMSAADDVAVGLVDVAAKTGGSWAKTSGILRDAVKGKGNYGLGSGTFDEAMQAGRSWVGEGFTISKDGSSWISSDGLRQFRPPSFKPKLNIEQANFQWRNVNKGAWQSNGHLDIIKP